MVTSMLEPGDQIDGMILATGAADAPPLWAFCFLIQQSGNVTSSYCSIPSMLPTLAIGHVFIVAEEALTDLDWSEFTWELSIDDQTIDLETFGTYDYVMPSMPRDHSHIREVFKKFTAWDVVLTNLKSGEHTLHGLAHSETDTYTWIVNFMIEAPYAIDLGSIP
jgi:hypothetical protein